MTAVPVAVEPTHDEHLVAAVEGAGGKIVGLDDARVLGAHHDVLRAAHERGAATGPGPVPHD